MTNFERVKEFMTTFGQEVKSEPEFPGDDVVDLRLDLIHEEFTELETAISQYIKKELSQQQALTEVSDALTDLLVVIYGAGHAFGIDLDQCFLEVHRSNMSKLGEDGKPIYREDGKILKGPGYSPPDLKSVIFPQQGGL